MEILNQKYIKLLSLHVYVRIIVFLLITTFLSCKKDADIKLPAVASKLVISSFISPQDTVVGVLLSRSQPLYNSSEQASFEVITNATVTIIGMSGARTLTFNPSTSKYELNTVTFSIVAGFTNTLIVITPDGDMATATTTIPELNASLSYSNKSISSNSLVAVLAKWQDPPGFQNFYRILSERNSMHVFSGQNINGQFSDTILIKGVADELLSDLENPGGTIFRNLQLVKERNASSASIHLLHLSKDYYLYTKKFPEATSTANAFTEPVHLYNNITGGLGIFAGYNRYSIEVAF